MHDLVSIKLRETTGEDGSETCGVCWETHVSSAKDRSSKSFARTIEQLPPGKGTCDWPAIRGLAGSGQVWDEPRIAVIPATPQTLYINVQI